MARTRVVVGLAALGGAIAGLALGRRWAARRARRAARERHAARAMAARTPARVELHVHFDGAFDAELLLADAGLDLDRLPASVASAWGEPIAVRAPVAACGADARAFAALTTCRGQRSLKAMIDCFEIFLPIARGRLALLETLACRFVENQALQGVVYTEVRYSPHLLCEGGELGGAPGAPSARALGRYALMSSPSGGRAVSGG